jgi:hypothetical protein
VMRFVDVFWMIKPALATSGAAFGFADAVLLLGIGGLWLAIFGWQLRRRPLLPADDPRLVNALAGARAAG